MKKLISIVICGLVMSCGGAISSGGTGTDGGTGGASTNTNTNTSTSTTLSEVNADVDFQSLSTGDLISLQAPDPSSSISTNSLMKHSDLPDSCACEWSCSVDGIISFNDRNACTTNAVIISEANGDITVSVDCGDLGSRDFTQNFVVQKSSNENDSNDDETLVSSSDDYTTDDVEEVFSTPGTLDDMDDMDDVVDNGTLDTANATDATGYYVSIYSDYDGYYTKTSDTCSKTISTSSDLTDLSIMYYGNLITLSSTSNSQFDLYNYSSSMPTFSYFIDSVYPVYTETYFVGDYNEVASYLASKGILGSGVGDQILAAHTANCAYLLFSYYNGSSYTDYISITCERNGYSCSAFYSK